MQGLAKRGRSGLLAQTGSVFASGTGLSSCGLLPGWCTGHRFLAAAEGFDDAHRAAAAWTRFAQGERDDLCGGLQILFRWCLAEQFADAVDGGLAGRSCQQAVVSDAVEAVHCLAGHVYMPEKGAGRASGTVE